MHQLPRSHRKGRYTRLSGLLCDRLYKGNCRVSDALDSLRRTLSADPAPRTTTRKEGGQGSCKLQVCTRVDPPSAEISNKTPGPPAFQISLKSKKPEFQISKIKKSRRTILTDTIEDLTQFVLVGKAKLQAYMLKLQTVNKLSVAQEIRDQTLKEAQDISNALIAAEQRIGELLLAIPSASGRRTDLETSSKQVEKVKTKTETVKEMGYSKDEASDYQQMAKHPEVVQRVIEDALAN